MKCQLATSERCWIGVNKEKLFFCTRPFVKKKQKTTGGRTKSGLQIRGLVHSLLFFSALKVKGAGLSGNKSDARAFLFIIVPFLWSCLVADGRKAPSTGVESPWYFSLFSPLLSLSLLSLFLSLNTRHTHTHSLLHSLLLSYISRKKDSFCAFIFPLEKKKKKEKETPKEGGLTRVVVHTAKRASSVLDSAERTTSSMFPTSQGISSLAVETLWKVCTRTIFRLQVFSSCVTGNWK